MKKAKSPKTKDVMSPQTKSPRSKDSKSLLAKDLKSPKMKETKSPKTKESMTPKINGSRSLKAKDSNSPMNKESKSTKTEAAKSPGNRKSRKSPKEKESNSSKTKLVGYLSDEQIKRGVLALKKYIKVNVSTDSDKGKPKDLLDAGKKSKSYPIMVEVVFKNIPSNSKTYIHNVVLPHHWRKTLAPEDYEMAIFVKHKKPETEAQKIQFDRDRELDIDNTHNYYKEQFDSKLTQENRAKISRIITSKELATEYNTHQKIDRLSKTYDLFIGDKRLVSNKFNALLRRLGRRFWVRERKVPMALKLEATNLNERFEKLMSIEPFYVIGNSSTERCQIGLSSQTVDELVINMNVFLQKLYKLYGDDVRFIKLRTNKGLSLPLFADLTNECPKEVKMQKKSVKRKAVEDDFDLLPNCKVRVNAGGTVKVIKKTEA